MSPENPFLRALLAQPDDDTLRLAMADWLDENDEPARAEFIRVQVELARGVEDRERRNVLEKRQAEILIEHKHEWVRPFLEALDGQEGESGGWEFDRSNYEPRYADKWWGDCVFRRGFAEYFHVPAAVMNRHGEKLARLAPVRELYLDHWIPVNIVWLCRKPWLRSLTALTVCSRRRPLPSEVEGLPEGERSLVQTLLHTNAVKALIACPYFENLRKMEVVASEDVPDEMAKEYYKRFGRHLVRMSNR
jgi:uncharacterized protein (TIGR02996 family)